MVLRRETELISKVKLKGELTEGDIYTSIVLPFQARFGKLVIIWQNNGVDVVIIKSVERARIFQIFLFTY